MMTNTSPRSTTKSRSRWITKLPYAIVRPLTWMRGAWSEADDIEDHREHPVQDDEQHDRRHYGRERGPRPARHDDGRHDAADLAGHRDGDQVGDEDRRPELLELDRADEGQDQSDQEADQRYDAERARAAVLDDEEEIGGTKPRASAQEGAEGEQALADERQSHRDSRCRPDGTGA